MIVDQTQTPRYASRFKPLLYVSALTQKDFHYIVYTGLPTQGTSTEDLGNTTLEYTTPLSNKHNLYTRGKAKQQSPLTRGISTMTNQSQSPLHKRDTNKYKEDYNSWWSQQPQTNFLTKTRS